VQPNALRCRRVQSMDTVWARMASSQIVRRDYLVEPNISGASHGWRPVSKESYRVTSISPVDLPTLPTARWALTAPESTVLLNGVGDGVVACKLAVMDLVARGALRLVTVEGKGLLGRTTRTAVLASGLHAQVDDGVLETIMAVYRAQKQKTFQDGTTGVEVRVLAVALRNKFRPVAQYVSQVVLPALADRGLYERKTGKLLFIIPTSKWVRTASGDAARAELQQWLAVSREQFAALVRADARQAATHVSLAGAALLLSSALLPELKQLSNEIGGLADLGSVDFGQFDSGLDAFDTDFDVSTSDSDSSSSSSD
jgi:hypothetical protein